MRYACDRDGRQLRRDAERQLGRVVGPDNEVELVDAKRDWWRSAGHAALWRSELVGLDWEVVGTQREVAQL